MPIMSVFVGEKEISALLVKSPKEFRFSQVPFAYSSSVHSLVYKEKGFYSKVFEYFLKVFDLNPVGTDIILASILEKDMEGLGLKMYKLVGDILSDGFQHTGYLVEKDILENDSGLAFQTNFLDLNSTRAISNIISNLNILKISVSQDSELVDLTDKNLRAISLMPKPSSEKIGITHQITFTGTRFTQFYADDISKYLLCLDLAKIPGDVHIKLDRNNSFIPLTLLKYYDLGAYEIIREEVNFETLGTLINSPGDTECLIKSMSGTDQLLDIKTNKVVFIPLEDNSRAEVLLKSLKVPEAKYVVRGGKLGLMIDTREKNSSEYFSGKEYKKYLVEARVGAERALNRLR